MPQVLAKVDVNTVKIYSPFKCDFFGCVAGCSTQNKVHESFNIKSLSLSGGSFSSLSICGHTPPVQLVQQLPLEK